MWMLHGYYSRRLPSHRLLPHVYLRHILDAIGDHLKLNVLQIDQCLSLLRDFEFRESLLRYSASNLLPNGFHRLINSNLGSVGKLRELCTVRVRQNLGWGVSMSSLSPPVLNQAQSTRRT